MPTTTVVSRAKAYLKARQKSVRDAMKQLQLDGVMLTHAPDLAYLSNFTGDDSVGLITPKDFFLVTDFRYKEQAEQEAGWLKISMREGRMAEALAKTLLESKARRIGFEANYATVGQIDALHKALAEQTKDQKDLKAPELVGLDNVM